MMNLPKRIERNTLILTILVLLLSLVVWYFSLQHQFNNSANKQFQERYISAQKLFNLNVEHEKRKFTHELKKIISIDGVVQAVSNKDTKKLKELIYPYFSDLKEVYKDVEILTFRSSRNITILRAHKPEYYGDKLNNKRRLIIDTGVLKQSLSGFEVGKLGMTYRITEPIFDKDRYIGNVEIGLNPIYLIKDLNNVFDMHLGLKIKKSLLSIMLDSASDSLDSEYVLLHGSEKIKEYFSHEASRFYNFDRDSFRIKMDIPLKNHISDTLGYLIVGFDVETILKENKEFMFSIFLITTLMIFVLGFLLYKGFEKILNYYTKQVYTDQLTGLKNRFALNDKLSRNSTKLLILSDIRDFSIINELYGVDVGNEVLVEVGKAFEEFANERNFDAFRISSDEYVLLKQKYEEEINYIETLDSLHKKINSLIIYIKSISESVKVDMHSGITFDNLHPLEEAQMALKKAKENSVPYLAYSKHVDTKEKAENIIQTKRIIHFALEHKNVIPYFQPITDADGKYIKYEALIRIIESDNGQKRVLLPGMFLEIAKENGLYIEIAKRMIEQSLSLFSNRQEKISINLYPSDLFNKYILETLVDNINKFDSPSKIVIEITEEESIEDFNQLLKAIKMLRKLGVSIAIDDFGSGYANYAHILKIKPDYLKIDGSLIKNVIANSESKILVRSIVNFAKDLNITTVAEYVENIEIFELLKEYGVDEFQGFYFSKPQDLLSKS